MIMWEFTSGTPPFDNEAHDLQLSIGICQGERPEIIGNTPQCYIDLMKECWDNDLLKRPNASAIKNIIKYWYKIISNRNIIDGIISKELRDSLIEFYEADKVLKEQQTNISSKSHPQAYHTSRLLDYTNQLNKILNQEKHIEAEYSGMFYFFII